MATTEHGASPQRRRNREATRAALLSVARTRFAAEGYTATNVRDIAKDAGVDPTLVFRYFGSKRKLFDEAMAEDARATEAILDGPPEQLPTRLLQTVLATDDWSGSPASHPLITMLRSADDDSIRDRLHDEMCETYIAGIRTLVHGPDADLRAELFSAWLLGISVVRSVVRSEALHSTTTAEVMPYFDQVADVLLGKPDS